MARKTRPIRHYHYQVAPEDTTGVPTSVVCLPDWDVYHQGMSEANCGSWVTQQVATSTFDAYNQNESMDIEPWAPYSKFRKGRHVRVVLRDGRTVEGMIVAVRVPCGCLLAMRPLDVSEEGSGLHDSVVRDSILRDASVVSYHDTLYVGGSDGVYEGYLDIVLFYRPMDIHSITVLDHKTNF